MSITDNGGLELNGTISTEWAYTTTDNIYTTDNTDHTITTGDGWIIQTPSTTPIYGNMPGITQPTDTWTTTGITWTQKIPGFLGETFVEDDILKIKLEDGEIVDVFDLKNGKQLASFYKIIAKKKLLDA